MERYSTPLVTREMKIKLQRDAASHPLGWLFKSRKVTGGAEGLEQSDPSYLARRQNGTAAVENGFGELKKLDIDFSVTVDD